mgnify:CR=1 FL=1
MKIKELIDSGKITADQAKIGYVGAYPFAEVISGFTAFYLGARSIVPEVTMTVKYVSSWSDATAEGNAAQALCDEGCVLISQHSDNTTPATVAQQNGVFHVGYNNDMTGIAPEASLISSRIDWSVYFEYVFDCLVNGETIAKDWTAGMKDGAVVVTELNEAIAAEGTAEKIAEVEAGLADGSIHVFQARGRARAPLTAPTLPTRRKCPPTTGSRNPISRAVRPPLRTSTGSSRASPPKTDPKQHIASRRSGETRLLSFQRPYFKKIVRKAKILFTFDVACAKLTLKVMQIPQQIHARKDDRFGVELQN